MADLSEILYGTPAAQGPMSMPPPPNAAPPLPQQIVPEPAPQGPQTTLPTAETVAHINAPSPDGGMNFTDKLRSDPALSQAMLMMGARMMQGQRAGQDAMGVLGDAVMIGNATHGMVKQNELAAAAAGRKEGRDTAESMANVESRRANTDATVTETSQKKALFPETQKKVAAEIRRLNAAGDKEAAQALQAQYRADPERLAIDWKLDVAKDQANINQSNAAAGASSANAKLTNQKVEAATELNADGQYGSVLHGSGKTGKSGASDKLVEAETMLAKAYPDETPQQISKRAADTLTGKKGEGLETLKFMAENGDAGQRKWAVAKMAERAGYTGDGTPATPAKKPAAGGTSGRYVLRPGANPDLKSSYDLVEYHERTLEN